MSHTRGEWTALGVDIYDANGKRIGSFEPYETHKSTDTCMANARLAAAAPHLLQALGCAVTVMEWTKNHGAPNVATVLSMARAALERAEPHTKEIAP